MATKKVPNRKPARPGRLGFHLLSLWLDQSDRDDLGRIMSALVEEMAASGVRGRINLAESARIAIRREAARTRKGASDG